MWDKCNLEGDGLAAKASSLLQDQDFAFDTFGGARQLFARVVETQQIYIDPPHSIERNMGHGKPREYERISQWRATVSARVRTYPNANLPHLGNVGRGSGDDPVTAALRAIVNSFGPGA